MADCYVVAEDSTRRRCFSMVINDWVPFYVLMANYFNSLIEV